MMLQQLNGVNNELIKEYVLLEEQLKFTGHPKDCVQLAKDDNDRTPILAIVENRLVTYFDLHQNEGVKPYSNNPNAILLRAFSTDAREQGKGYAKKALTLLPHYVREHFPHINEIVLAVNVKNDVAEALYYKCGYIDKGERRQGPKGELIIMSYDL